MASLPTTRVPSWAAPAGIVLLALLLRVLHLGTNPNGFFCDEASAGYDAYSIWKTGRDQHGVFLPIIAETLGDWDEAFYRYAIIPFLPLWGLNETATRLPAAVFGGGTVAVLYGLGSAIGGRKVGLLAAFLLAVSPWHLPLSRIGFRPVPMAFFFCLGFWLFLTGRDRPHRWLASAMAFAAGLYTYIPARVVTPLFLLALLWLYRSEVARRWRLVAACAALLALAVLPLLGFWSSRGMVRGFQTFSPPGQWISNYLSHFGPSFLFLHGDPNLRHHPQGMGQLLPVELLTVPIGLWSLRTLDSRLRNALLAWLIFYPVPGFMTSGNHAFRALLGAPLFALLSAQGMLALPGLLKSWKKKVASIIAMSIAVPVCASWFLWIYFVDYPRKSDTAWQFGYGPAITWTQASGAPCVKVSDQILMPHILLLFYLQYPPEQYQFDSIHTPGRNIDFEGRRIGKFQLTDFVLDIHPDSSCLYLHAADQEPPTAPPGSGWEVAYSVKNDQGFERVRVSALRTSPNP